MPNMKQMYEDNAHTEPAYPVVWLPIGTIYENRYDISDEIDKYFVGVWQRYGNGCVTVGVNESDSDFSTPNKTLGEKTHKLTVNEIPSHSHQTGISSNEGFKVTDRSVNDTANVYFAQTYSTTNTTGGSQSHNNIQPSITVYRWVRIS